MCCLLYKATKKRLDNNYTSPFFLISALLLWITFAMSIVATVSLHWIQYSNGGHEGIFIGCQEYNKQCWFLSSSSWIRSVQVLISLTCIFTWFASCNFSFATKNVGLAKTALVLTIMAAISSCAGCSVYTHYISKAD